MFITRGGGLLYLPPQNPYKPCADMLCVARFGHVILLPPTATPLIYSRCGYCGSSHIQHHTCLLPLLLFVCYISYLPSMDYPIFPYQAGDRTQEHSGETILRNQRNLLLPCILLAYLLLVFYCVCFWRWSFLSALPPNDRRLCPWSSPTLSLSCDTNNLLLATHISFPSWFYYTTCIEPKKFF